VWHTGLPGYFPGKGNVWSESELQLQHCPEKRRSTVTLSLALYLISKCWWVQIEPKLTFMGDLR
jgi:hypothetical protein